MQRRTYRIDLFKGSRKNVLIHKICSCGCCWWSLIRVTYMNPIHILWITVIIWAKYKNITRRIKYDKIYKHSDMFNARRIHTIFSLKESRIQKKCLFFAVLNLKRFSDTFCFKSNFWVTRKWFHVGPFFWQPIFDCNKCIKTFLKNLSRIG